jgi:hypothetical protein
VDRQAGKPQTGKDRSQRMGERQATLRLAEHDHPRREGTAEIAAFLLIRRAGKGIRGVDFCSVVGILIFL